MPDFFYAISHGRIIMFMKKIYSALFCGILALIFTDCASNSFALNSYGSAAVVGVKGNKNLSEQTDTIFVRSDEEDIDDTSILSLLTDKFLHSENSELLTAQDRVDYAEEYFHTAIEEIAGIKVAEKNDVIESEAYKNSSKNIFEIFDTWISATGFNKNLYSIGAKKARMLMQELGVDMLITADFRFNKLFADESKVRTTVRAQVIMDVIVYDSNGKKIIMDSFEATSFEKLDVKRFKYDTDALIDSYPATIESVINKFIMKYTL